MKRWLGLMVVANVLLAGCADEQAERANPVSMDGEAYQHYKTPGLDQPVIRQRDILPLIEALREQPLLSVEQIGESYEGRPLFSIALGQGETRVLMWSQMHGDEPTATPALFDLLNYITAPEQADWRAQWMDKISLVIVPMLNPDGAERNARHNAQSFDINRDAKALQSPEGRVLMQLARDFKPHFGFNLHDQSRYYGVGDTGKMATISVLAPAYNAAREVNQSRGDAMRLIGELVQHIHPMLGEHIAKYDDTYAWRAFGDTFSEMGISTILIESGAHPSDPNRQVARQMNVHMLSAAIDSIASGSYRAVSRDIYDNLPFNEDDALVDLKITNVQAGELSYRTDIGIRERFGQVTVVEVGDLSNLTGAAQFDADGAQYRMAKPYVLQDGEVLELTDQRYLALLRQEFGYFVGDSAQLVRETQFPVVINPQRLQGELPTRRRNATFLLAKDGKVQLAVLDGEMIRVEPAQSSDG